MDVVPAETRDICRQSQQPLTLRSEFESLDSELTAKASSAKKLIENEVFPLLKQMQLLLAQRSPDKLSEEGLPTWTAYYEEFRKRYALRSLRTFQRQLAADSGKPKPKRKPVKPIRDDGYRPLLTDLLDQLDKVRDQLPASLHRTIDECREALKQPTRPVRKPAATSSEKESERASKGLNKVVASTLKQGLGRLIRI